MSDIAISVDNISKLYQIGDTSSGSLRETITGFFSSGKNVRTEDFWALKDISFQVKKGEAVGIVGKNGAGKSTLLKVLSRITEPTQGRIEINGRVSSLLEVGTGFHPELTGRENVFLNGTILGMSRAEVKSKFDEIVDFSGVEKFLDTPVKRYSSGMKVRLAFAVAAHLEPEILIVDEVLAVGDADFQKKCLGKMEDVAGQGRTILFVSHNMAAVKNLCSRSILLKGGHLVKEDTTEKVVDYYLQNSTNLTSVVEIAPPSGEHVVGYAEKVLIENEYGSPTSILPLAKPWQVKVYFKVKEKIPHFVVSLGFTTSEDVAIKTTWSKPRDISPGRYVATFREEQIFFTSGKYKLKVGLSSRQRPVHYVPDAGYIEFEDYVDKSIALRSNSGIVLNQMHVEIDHADKINSI